MDVELQEQESFCMSSEHASLAFQLSSSWLGSSEPNTLARHPRDEKEEEQSQEQESSVTERWGWFRGQRGFSQKHMGGLRGPWTHRQ